MTHPLAPFRLDPFELMCAAEEALRGVGVEGPDTEWRDYYEDSGGYHLRRRLAPDEEKVTGPVRDIRGTNEALRRAHEAFYANPSLIYVQACVDEMRSIGYPIDQYLKRK